MGWKQIMVDIGTMMTASVAMGVAVDDTVHFLHKYQFARQSGQMAEAAIHYAF